jgi:outer membrane lipoprotein-sorting protein
MKINSLLFSLLMPAFFMNAQLISLDIDAGAPKTKFENGKDLVDFMYQKYRQGPCKAYTFSQKNTHYRNDSVIGHSEWHEFIEFPDKFRINFGDPEEGNFVIFKNDSSYSYKKNELKKTNYNSNNLLLLLGGMYYREVPDVVARLEKEGYNTKLISTQKWNKQNIQVIGALEGDTISNQIWVTKKNWRVVRIIEQMDDGSYMDMTFDDFQKNCNGYTETKVTFKRNGKIEQVEEYHDIKPVDSFSSDVFNPKKP